jgi:predicted type IV restriction endonuclease
MMPIPKRVIERMQSGLKRMTPIIDQQKTRDVSEADTVTLVKDLLAEVFGYDKYAEVTGEFAIRGTFCDLAIKLESKLSMLIEVKAIGIALDDRHVKQAVDYAANQGVEWVILTNANDWRLYHVIFAKPIDKRLVLEMSLIGLDAKDEDKLEQLFVASKEGFTRGAHVELRDHQEATSRYMLAALLMNNEAVQSVIARELRRVVEVRVENRKLAAILQNEVIKRDAIEGPAYEAAVKVISQHEARQLRAQQKAAKSDGAGVVVADVVVAESDGGGGTVNAESGVGGSDANVQ